MDKEKTKEIKSVYAEIKGYLRDAPTKEVHLGNLTFKENLDDCIDQLNILTGKDYSKFKVVAIASVNAGYPPHFETAEYRSKLSALVNKLHTEYFADESHPFSDAPSMVINQTQSQIQEQNIALNILIKNAVDTIEENYGAIQSKKARELLEELEKDKKWSTVSKTVEWFLNLGRDAFVSILPVLTQIIIGK